MIIHYVDSFFDEEEGEEEPEEEPEEVEEEPEDEEEEVDDDVAWLTNKLSNLSIASEPDPKIVALIEKRKLTKESLEKVEFTELLRIAMYNEYAGKFILDNFGVRGMPIKRTIKDSEGKMVPVLIKDYQCQAIAWMKGREALPRNDHYGLRGGIICMKMGLGKTLASLTHSLTTPKRPGDFPTLVIASKTVAQEWKLSGVKKFFDDRLKAIYLHKDFMGAAVNAVTRRHVLGADIVITTYDACMSACKNGDWWEDCFERGEQGIHKDKIVQIHNRTRSQSDDPSKSGLDIIYATPWARVIADESQRFNNPKTSLYKAMMAVYGEKKWCLTGTPIRNYETDIWAQLRFIGYSGVDNATEWRKYGQKKYVEHNLRAAIFTMDYQDANVKLPKLHEYPVITSLTDNELKIYQYILGETKGIYDQVLSRVCSFACVLAMFMRLRQCCIAPYLITADSKREKGKITKAASEGNTQASETVKRALSKFGEWLHDKTGTAGYRSAKMLRAINTLKQIPKGEKALVFSSFTSCLDLLADGLAELHPKFKYLMIDGDTKGHEREEILKRWRSDDSVNGLFLTYKVGSEGLNLDEANHVVMIEPWWNNSVPDQAKARAWRTGQTREVHVHNIFVNESIEDKMREICREKAERAAHYLEGTEHKVKKNGGLDMATLGRILGVRNQ